MKDKDFDNLFKHKFSNLNQPEADLSQWSEIQGKLTYKKVGLSWRQFGWMAAASVLLVSNIYFLYQWQNSKTALAQLKNSTEQTSTQKEKSSTSVHAKSTISNKNITNTEINSNIDNKTTLNTVKTQTPLDNIEYKTHQPITQKTEFRSHKAIQNKSIRNNKVKNQEALTPKSNIINSEINSLLVNTKTDKPTLTEGSSENKIYSDGQLNQKTDITGTEPNTREDKNETALVNKNSTNSNIEDQLNIPQQNTETNLISQQTIDKSNTTELQANNENIIVPIDQNQLPAKKKLAFPKMSLGLWAGGVLPNLPKSTNNIETTFGLIAEAVIWKGFSLGATAGKMNIEISSNKPDFFKGHIPPKHPDPDIKFKGLESNKINIDQYGLFMKYQFDYIKRWRPYFSAGIVFSQADELRIKFKFEDPKHKDDDIIIEQRITDQSSGIQGINFAAGMNYRLSNRWAIFAEGNFIKNIKPDSPANFDSSSAKVGIVFQL
jgi:hypothetical protein